MLQQAGAEGRNIKDIYWQSVQKKCTRVLHQLEGGLQDAGVLRALPRKLSKVLCVGLCDL